MPDYFAGSSEGDREYAEMCNQRDSDRKAFAAGSMAVDPNSNHEITFYAMPQKVCGVFAPKWPEDAVALLMRAKDGNITLYQRRSDYPPRGDDWIGYAFVTVQEDPEVQGRIDREADEIRAKMVNTGLLPAKLVSEILATETKAMKQKGYDWPRARKSIDAALEKAVVEAATAKLKDAFK